MIALRAQQVKPSIHFQFVAIPAEILRSKTISPAAKLLLAVLMDSARSNRSGLSRLCNATLGARIGRSASEVGRHLAELEAAGVVRREFGESKRTRLGVAISWVPEIPATQESTSTRSAQPGYLDSVNRVQPGSATIQTPSSDSSIQTGVSLSTEGEKTPDDPKPTPEEIATALRAMTAGKYAPVIWPSNALTRPESTSPGRAGVPQAAGGPPAALPRDVRDLARGSTVDARRAAYVKPGGGRRKTAQQQLVELREWSARRST